jgi:23S rRNA pseudouridine2605 synthase
MRLNKFISSCGIASRRAADTLILEGRVMVNNEVVKELGSQVSPSDTVLVDGKLAHLPQKTTIILFHKPPGCVCSASDPQGRKTVYDYLPPGYRGLKYIGRLDLQSRGLLLFTDNGELAHRLTHPSYQIQRSYLVWSEPELSKQDAERIINGVDIGDGETGHAEAIYLKKGFVEMVLTEGKNREIRRMMEALSYRINDLKRISFCGIPLGTTPACDFRELSPDEVQMILKVCEL